MKIADLLPAIPDRKWALARQMGVRFAIAKLAPELTHAPPPWDFDALLRAKTRFAEGGFTLTGLEGDQFDMQRVKRGLPGRDEDIERYRQMLRNMGRLGINLLCYNFMAVIGWYRTAVAVPARGGALVSGFDQELIRDAPPTEAGMLTADQLWSNYAYFLRAVMPVAEQAGVRMALHPDDPPVSNLRGIARIFISADALRRALAIAPSSANGLTFCQATLGLMGENVAGLIGEWGNAHKIFFVHFRDVRGTAGRFVETFHDDGPTDMAAMLRAYHAAGFDGPLRVDHVPALEGESVGPMRPGDALSVGYETLGRLFAIGYVKGLLEGAGIAYE
jgi:mannonate dehydratase